MLRMSALSTEYVQYEVEAAIRGVPYAATSDPVYFAFLPVGSDPGPADWVRGSWTTWTTYGPLRYVARCLVGPAGHALPEGDYVVWLKVIDGPAVPARDVGTLTIT